MIGARITLRKAAANEGEKPFWISFADLMTALMVLFLLVMSVALLAVTKRMARIRSVRNTLRKRTTRILHRPVLVSTPSR